MADEKTQGAGTLTEDAPGENTVQVTFLPEGKTVQFENGKLPYEDHGKEQSLLDVALNFGITLDHACGGICAWQPRREFNWRSAAMSNRSASSSSISARFSAPSFTQT